MANDCKMWKQNFEQTSMTFCACSRPRVCCSIIHKYRVQRLTLPLPAANHMLDLGEKIQIIPTFPFLRTIQPL